MIRPKIELQHTDDKAVAAAIDRLTAALILQREKDGDRSFAMCGCSARAGTTTLASEVAISLSAAGWKTLLIHADTKKGEDCGSYGKVGLYDYSIGKADEQELLENTNWDGLTYISCGNVSEEQRVKALISEKTEQLIGRLHESYDFVIWDTPACCGSIDGKIIASKTDGTLLVAASRETTFDELERAKKDLEKGNAKIIGVALTKTVTLKRGTDI